jgi:hypothetical protein
MNYEIASVIRQKRRPRNDNKENVELNYVIASVAKQSLLDNKEEVFKCSV